MRQHHTHVRDHQRAIPLIRAFALLVCSLAFSALAQLPVARLFTVFPPGGKAGSSVEVEVAGQDLDAPRELHFSDPRITAKHLDGPKFKVFLPSELEPSLCDVRVAGRFGISNPRAFEVENLSEVVAPATNTAPETAFPVSINCIINGRSVSEAFQFFRFSGRKGQRIHVECKAADLDSRLHPALSLLDANGRELTRRSGDEILDLAVTEDSEYLLKLYDFLYRGGPEYFYRLVLSTGPRIDYIFPPAAMPGSKAKVNLFGRNLPGSVPATNAALGGVSLERLEIEIDVPEIPDIKPASTAALLRPAAAQLDGFEYRLHSSNGVSNPMFVSFARGNLVSEREPNDKPASAQTIQLPCSFAGQFYPANDRDWVRFEARKDDVIWIEAVSQRLGLPTSPFMVVQRVTTNSSGEEKLIDVREAGESENVPDFKTGSLDPSWRFEVKENGRYQIEIQDLFNSRSDPRRVYLLSLRKEDPDFSLVALPWGSSAKKDSKEATIAVPFIRKRETIPIKVVALRHGLTGAIELSAFGLPDSIQVAPARIEASTNSTLLFLTANNECHGWSGSFDILGAASTGSRQLVRRARLTTTTWNSADVSVDPARARFARDLALAVSGDETAPLALSANEDKTWEACAGAKAQIPCTATRQPDFNSALKLKPLGLPPSAAKELDIDAKATNSVLQLDLAKVQPGDYLFVLSGEAQGKYQPPTNSTVKPKDVTVSVYSKPIHLHVTPAPSK